MLPRDFFNLLRKQKGAEFEAFIREHVIPFEADMDKPLLGLAPDMLTELHEQVRPRSNLQTLLSRPHASTGCLSLFYMSML